MRPSLIFISLACILLSNGCNIHPKNRRLVNRHISMAYHYDSLKNYIGAIDEINKAIQLDSDYSGSYYLRGAMKVKYNHDTASAKKDLNIALKLDPKMTPAYFYRSRLYGSQRQWAKALSDINMAIFYYPKNYNMKMNKGYILDELHRYKEAKAVLNTVILKDPDDAYALNNRGDAEMNLGDLPAAYADIRKSLSLKSDNAYAYRNMAEYYLMKNQFDSASINIQHGKQYLTYFPVVTNDLDSLDNLLSNRMNFKK